MKRRLNALSVFGVVFIAIVLSGIAYSTIYIDGTTDTINVTYMEGFSSKGDINMSGNEIFNSPSLQETADYVIWTDGSMYYAKNSSGNVEYSNSDFVTLVQNVIDKLNSEGGGQIFFKPGTYNMTNTITLKSNVQLVGSGIEKTIFRLNDNVNKDMINSTDSVSYVIIQGITFDGNGDHQSSGHGIHANLHISIIRNNLFKNINQTAIFVGDPNIGSSMAFLIRIIQNEIHSAGQYGIWLEYKQTDSWVIGNNVGVDVADLRAGGGVARILYNHFDGNPEYNVYITGTSAYIYSHNIFENSKKHNIYAPEMGYKAAIINSAFINNLIRDPGTDANNTYSYIRLEGTTNGGGMNVSVIISNNIFTDEYNRALHIVSTNKYADVQITNNLLPTTVEDPWDIPSDAKAKIFNNKGDNSIRGFSNSLLTNGERLMGYWSFDEKSGDLAYDSAGNHDGICSGGSCPSRSFGRYGNALYCDGNDELDIEIEFKQNENKTYSMWLYSNLNTTIFDHGGWNGSDNVGIRVKSLEANDYKVCWESQAEWNIRCSSIPLKRNEWTYLVIVYHSNGDVEMYQDGILTMNESNWTSYYDGGKLEICNGDYNGLIDEFKLWNRTLSYREIQAEYLLGISSHRGGGEKLDKTGGTLTGTLNTGKYLNITSTDYGTCDSSMEGIIVYNSTSKHFYGCNSTNWVQLG